MLENPSPTPPHKGEGLSRGSRSAHIGRFNMRQASKQMRTEPQVKPLPLVGTGWGGVFLSLEWRVVQ
jgi:hypothetical protein